MGELLQLSDSGAFLCFAPESSFFFFWERACFLSPPLYFVARIALPCSSAFLPKLHLNTAHATLNVEWKFSGSIHIVTWEHELEEATSKAAGSNKVIAKIKGSLHVTVDSVGTLPCQYYSMVYSVKASCLWSLFCLNVQILNCFWSPNCITKLLVLTNARIHRILIQQMAAEGRPM